MGSGHRPLTDEERKLFQGIISGAYEQFLEAVCQGRIYDPKSEPQGKTASGRVQVLKTKDQVRAAADGRVYVGSEAKRIGLVDELGDLEDAVKKAGQLAGLGDSPKIIKVSTTGIEELLGSLSTESVADRVTGSIESLVGPRPPIWYLYRTGL
jgi:protease-4